MVRIELHLPRDSRYVTILRTVAACLLRDMKVPDEPAHDVQLVLSEACGNVVRHAKDTLEYSVTLAVDDDGCEIEVRDLGPGFRPAAPGQPQDPASEAGRGLLLMRALVDDLQFIRGDDATRVRLVKRWPQDGLQAGPPPLADGLTPPASPR
jgi:serine/threonine-protein kinase RsbW